MTSFDFTAKLNFGQITQAQIEGIENSLKNTEVTKVLSTPVFLIFDDNKGTQITVEPQQLNFRIARECEIEEILEDANIISAILHALIGENDVEVCVMRFVNIFKSDTDKAFEKLREKTGFDLSNGCLSNIQTVGYRFLMKTDSFYDEIRVEPLLREPDELFIEGIYNKTRVCANRVIENVDSAYNDYKTKTQFFIDEM